MTEYAQLTVPKLKDLLSSRGLSTKGLKADLITRLQESDAAVATSSQDDPVEKIQAEENQRESPAEKTTTESEVGKSSSEGPNERSGSGDTEITNDPLAKEDSAREHEEEVAQDKSMNVVEATHPEAVSSTSEGDVSSTLLNRTSPRKRAPVLTDQDSEASAKRQRTDEKEINLQNAQNTEHSMQNDTKEQTNAVTFHETSPAVITNANGESRSERRSGVTVVKRPKPPLSDSQVAAPIPNEVANKSINRPDVPPPTEPLSDTLEISNFVRPLRINEVEELLSQYGSVKQFWMNKIKSHCYVTYETVEQALAARNGTFDLKFPPETGREIKPLFMTREAADERIGEHEKGNGKTNSLPDIGTSSWQRRSLSDHLSSANSIAIKKASIDAGAKKVTTRSPSPPPPKKGPSDFFKLTEAKPRLYYLPVSSEEVESRRKSRTRVL